MAAQAPRQMEYSISVRSEDLPCLCNGLNGAVLPLAAERYCCSLTVRVAYPGVEGSNECYTVYFPRLIDFNRTFRNGWRKSQPLCSKVLRSRSVNHNARFVVITFQKYRNFWKYKTEKNISSLQNEFPCEKFLSSYIYKYKQ